MRAITMNKKIKIFNDYIFAYNFLIILKKYPSDKHYLLLMWRLYF